MQDWNIALVILLAVLTGVLLPVLFQLRATLRSAQLVLDQAGPRLNASLDALQHTLDPASKVASELAARMPEIRAWSGTVSTLLADLTKLLATLRGGAALSATIGPVVVAALSAFTAMRAKDATSRAPAKAGDETAANPSPIEQDHV